MTALISLGFFLLALSQIFYKKLSRRRPVDELSPAQQTRYIPDRQLRVWQWVLVPFLLLCSAATAYMALRGY